MINERRRRAPRGARGVAPGRRRAALLASGASLVLLATAAGTSAAATGQPGPAGAQGGSGALPLGAGHMGIGYQHDTRSLQVGPLSSSGGVQGIDVSHYQGSVNWKSVRAAGIQFAWIKATEGTSYKDPKFNSNYLNAYKRKVIRGAYHFARPDVSGGAAQAKYFASHGGAWSKDNLTLPGVLDLEGSCYGRSHASMRSWISSFYSAYRAKTGRDVLLYTSASWWSSCTGNWSGMAKKSPLWDAHWTSAGSPKVPGGFPFWTVWQYTSSGHVSGVPGRADRDKFNGSRARLVALANNTK